MVSITLPGEAEFSSLKRVRILREDIRTQLHRTAEIRLLAIKPAFRGLGIYDRLMLAYSPARPGCYLCAACAQ